MVPFKGVHVKYSNIFELRSIHVRKTTKWKDKKNRKPTRFKLKCDGTRWRTGGEVKGKLANAVGSQYPSHYLGTWCIQHYYRWCAHLGCASSRLNWRRRRFKWTRPFRPEDEIWFLCVCHHFSTGLYHPLFALTGWEERSHAIRVTYSFLVLKPLPSKIPLNLVLFGM